MERIRFYKIKSLNQTEEIDHLNQTNQSWPVNLTQFKSLVAHVNPDEYNHLNGFFRGILYRKNTVFCVNKSNLDEFSHENKIQEFPYSVLFSLLLHRIISQRSGSRKLYFHMNFSNRNLPIPNIKELITNLATGLPVFFDGTNRSAKELALHMQETLNGYFKSMSYGGITEIWQKELIPRRILLPKNIPYTIIYTYINKIVEDEYVQNRYIDWQAIEQDINLDKKGLIFLRIYNMGSYFVIYFDSQMSEGIHDMLCEDLRKSLLT